MKRQIGVLTIIIVFLSCLSGWAANYQDGASGAQSLEIGLGVRAEGMGGAFCAVADDINALSWNPAGLGRIEKIEISPGQYQLLDGINCNYISAIYPLRGVRASNVEEMGALGASLMFLDSEEISGRDSNGQVTADFKVQDRIITLAYGKKIAKNTFFGITGKHLRQEIQSERAEAYAYDAGLLYYPGIENISFGLAVQNMGDKFKFFNEEDKLPLNVKLGIANSIFADRLILAADFNKPKYSNYYTNLGAEWKIDKVFRLRLGYDSSNDAGSGLALGMGMNLKDVDISFMPVAEIVLDYAYLPYGDLGITHRVALTLKIGTE